MSDPVAVAVPTPPPSPPVATPPDTANGHLNLPPEPWFHGLQAWEKVLVGAVVVFWLAVMVGSRYTRQVIAWKNIWWGIGFPAAILGPAFIRARRLSLETAIRRFLADDGRITDVYNRFVHRIEIDREPLVVGAIAGVCFFLFRVASAWEVLPTLYGTWFMRLLLVFHPCGLGYMAATVWYLLAFGLLINRVSQELESRQRDLFSWELLEQMGKAYGRAAAGAAVLSLGFLAMVLTNLKMFAGELHVRPLQVITMELICAVALALPFAYLVIPQWRLHRILVARKQEIRELFYGRFLATEREFLRRPDCPLAQQYLASRQIIAEIENLPEWPFRFETLATVVSVFAIPAGLFFLKEVLVDVLVGLFRS